MRTAVVTGGAQGIGRGVVERLLGEGWAVMAIDLDRVALRELADAHAPRPLLTRQADVGDEAAVAELFTAYAAWRTEIGAGAFIGSGTMLVAPVKVGAGATIGAGSTITRDTPDDRLTLERSKQVTIESWKRPQKK